ncbi:MAG TPA: methyltransferase domain-containing protein, partial [Burkholderiaceae bacterium]|nr:methyltransferase domain-containing protein [Burkholderiaceae bacterium]
ITMPFRPTDFTQVNHLINSTLVGRAIRLLDPQPHERSLDLFCGIGNFTLALATRSRETVGVEGSAELVRRAQHNAQLNGLASQVRFEQANLFEPNDAQWSALGEFDRVLIDPPREGALEVAKRLAQPQRPPHRIVYVSCNPATLARDAGVLCSVGEWQLSAAGVVNMFPHTSHVESIAVFDPRQ